MPKNIEIHNSEELIEYFKKHYSVKLFNKIVRDAYQQKRESKYSLQVADLETEFSEKWVENIIKITLKYFRCEDIKLKIGCFDLKDVCNDAFRYPKNELKIELNYTNIVHRISKDDVRIVLKDIYELKNAFNSLRFLFDTYEDIK